MAHANLQTGKRDGTPFFSCQPTVELAFGSLKFFPQLQNNVTHSWLTTAYAEPFCEEISMVNLMGIEGRFG